MSPPDSSQPAVNIPALDESWYLPRDRLVNLIPDSARVIVLQGKAGQGKSVFASALYETLDGTSAERKLWLSLADTDNRSFLRRLADDVSNLLTKAEQKSFWQEIDFDQFDDTTNFNQLVHYLGKSTHEYMAVFDDVDAFETGATEESLWVQFLLKAPANVRRIVCTRTEITPLRRLLAGHYGVRLSDTTLAYTMDETIRLLSKDRRTDPGSAIKIWENLQGWPIVMASVQQWLIEHPEESISADSMQKLLEDGFGLILDSMSENSRATLCELSFFAQLDKRQLDARPHSNEALSQCGDLISQKHGVLVIIEPLRDFLMHQRTRILSSNAISQLLQQAANESIARGQHFDALDSLTQLGDTDWLAEFLSEYGSKIPAEKWQDSVGCISRLQPAIVESSPWIRLYTGRWSEGIAVSTTHDYVSGAVSQFEAQQDARGEFVALIYLAEHLLNVGRPNEFMHLFGRLEELGSLMDGQLSTEDQITRHINLAGLQIYCLGDTEATNRHLDAAQILLADHYMPDEHSVMHCFRAIDHIFNKRTEAAFHAIELLGRIPETFRADTPITAAFVKANFLPVIGDITGLEHLVAETAEQLKPEVVDQRQTGGFMTITRTQILLFAGKYEEAHHLMLKGAQTYAFIARGDAREMSRIMMALTHAIQGQKKQAVSALSQFERFSDTPPYRFRQMLTMALAKIYLEDWPGVTEVLTPLLQLEIEDTTYRNTAHGIHAYSLHRQGKSEEAKASVMEWVQAVMQKEAATLLTLGNTRDCYAYLIKTSGKLVGEDPGFRQYLQASHSNYSDLAFSEDFDLIPTLRLKTGPGYGFSLAGVPLALTKSQRRLLLQIALAPNQKISTATLMDRLWPDEEGAENRLYTLTSRTKKVFGQAGANLSDYLQISTGEMALVNDWIDCIDFEKHLAQAEAYERQNYHSFTNLTRINALDSWSGTWDPELESLVELSDLHLHLRLTYQRICISLSSEANQTVVNLKKLVSYLTPLFSLEPENIGLAASLSKLYQRLGDNTGIYTTRKQLKDGLLSLDLGEDAIDQQLSEFDNLSSATSSG